MDLLQMSPDVAKDTRRLSTRVNQKKKRSTHIPSKYTRFDENDEEIGTEMHSAQVNTHAVYIRQVQSTDPPQFRTAPGISVASASNQTNQFQQGYYPVLEANVHVNQNDKAWRMPGTVITELYGTKTAVELTPKEVLNDQGSELNVITLSLAFALQLPVQPLRFHGLEGGIHMNTADGSYHKLTEWVTMYFGVHGIYRAVEAFIRPNSENDEQLLILGLPYLYAVNAIFYIRDSQLWIGTGEDGEDQIMIQGPRFVPSTKQKLLLIPETKHAFEGAPVYEYAFTKDAIPTTSGPTTRGYNHPYTSPDQKQDSDSGSDADEEEDTESDRSQSKEDDSDDSDDSDSGSDDQTPEQTTRIARPDGRSAQFSRNLSPPPVNSVLSTQFNWNRQRKATPRKNSPPPARLDDSVGFDGSDKSDGDSQMSNPLNSLPFASEN